MNEEPVSNDAALRQEVRQLGTCLRVAMLMMLVPPLLHASWLLLRAPGFETVFEDMLGSTQKLPEVTKIVVLAPTAVLAAFWGLAGLAAFTMFLTRKALPAALIGLGTFVILVVGSQLIAMALLEPVVQIVRDLSGDSP